MEFNFELELENLYEDLKRITNKEMRTYPIEDREDVVHNMIVKVLTYKGAFDPSYREDKDVQKAFRQWAIKVLYNEIYEYMRELNKYNSTIHGEDYAVDEIDPERIALGEEALNKLLQTVTRRDKEILFMYHLEGKDVDFISLKTGLSKSMVYKVLKIEE